MLQKALASWPEMDFVQVYEMTEMGGVITSLSPLAHRDPEHRERLTSAGQVVADGQVRVVDPATGEDCAVGQVRELWFHTPQLMKGYLGKPEACAQAWCDRGPGRGDRVDARTPRGLQVSEVGRRGGCLAAQPLRQDSQARVRAPHWAGRDSAIA